MDLEAFLRSVLEPVLDYPGELNIEINKDGDKMDVFLYARQEDRGRIIGRSGRMISSLRVLCKAAGDKQGLHVNLELIEDETDGLGMEV